MAQNDMEVIIYKILRYLYDSMKAGKCPREEDFCCSCRMFNIPLIYWNQIIIEMSENELIKGVLITETKDGTLIDTSGARITMDGSQYLLNKGQKTEGVIT
ncbi:MAG: hypothetical protein IJH64_08480 [Oscillospiraceae bacterium]|nr:hypothetical protein [Oscillospiraceae bacterium]